MMNYIVLNGVKSDSINGLMICKLPAIVKPKIRTQIEEIDGRDGDLITPLGYSAYDKTFEIGLYGDFNIDEIIAYFDSKGTVTFSNEDDKYYKYDIIDQIDFERLLRFKTATVTMHVQPFKYSLVDVMKSFVINPNLIELTNFTKTTNGITVTTTEEGLITVAGTGTAATEFYVPINQIKLDDGTYTLAAHASGTEPQVCSIRLIYNSPAAVNSFGGTYVTLSNNNIVKIESVVKTDPTYNYIYFYITANKKMDFTIDLSLKNNVNEELVIRNNGNIVSKPTVTIYGADTINISLNTVQVFVIELGNEGFITIDVASMNAYKEGVLKNRLVTGNYDNFVLNVGKNVINVTGNVTKINIENFSRWI